MKDQSLSVHLRLTLSLLRAFAHAVLSAKKVLPQLCVWWSPSHLPNLQLNTAFLENPSLNTQTKIASLLPRSLKISDVFFHIITLFHSYVVYLLPDSPLKGP